MQKLADFGFTNLQTQIELLKTTTILNNIQFMREAKILVQNHNVTSILQTGSLQSEFTNVAGDRYVSYFLLKGDMINLKGWGVTEDSIPKHIGSFKDMPFTITSNKFFPDSPYGELTDHPVTDHFRKLGITRPIERNDMIQQSKFQEEFRVGNIDDVFKDVEGNWMAFIKIKPQFASMQMPPLVSPAIFQLDRTEPAGHITNWLGMHLTGLDESPAYGNIALFKGSCDGTKGECMRKLSASMNSKFDKIVTPCQIKKINTLIASTEIDFKLLKLQIAAQLSSDHLNIQAKPLLCKKDNKLTSCPQQELF